MQKPLKVKPVSLLSRVRNYECGPVGPKWDRNFTNDDAASV